jgi:hypothetical protein
MRLHDGKKLLKYCPHSHTPADISLISVSKPQGLFICFYSNGFCYNDVNHTGSVSAKRIWGIPVKYTFRERSERWDVEYEAIGSCPREEAAVDEECHETNFTEE